MGTPGSGRYIDYIPIKNTESTFRWKRLKGLFNDLMENGDFYSSPGDVPAAAQSVRAIAVQYANDFDVSTWSINPKNTPVPNLADVKRNAAAATAKAGFPVNPYMPDLRSPGPIGTLGVPSEQAAGSLSDWSLPSADPNPNLGEPSLAPADYKPNYVLGQNGTASPSENVVSTSITLNGTSLNFGSFNKK